MRPEKVLTAAQMGAVDRATIEAGIPGIILMENAAHRCVEYIAAKFGPVSQQRIAVVCGKGNNGGDGLAIARQLYVRFRPAELWVVMAEDPAELKGDAAANYAMLHGCGLQEYRDFGPEMQCATLVVDAVLGTGLRGAASGSALNAIRQINSAFPYAKVFCVDIPSGLSGDSGAISGEYVRADATVTFTALKVCHAVPPASRLMGERKNEPIGSPSVLFEDDPTIKLGLISADSIRAAFAPRVRDSNKGKYGHVLVVAGSRGKSGAAAMCGLSALKAGAGLVTVACPGSVLDAVAGFSPEVMTADIPEESSFSRVSELAETMSVIAVGPGIGTDPETRAMVLRLVNEKTKPMVVDADALNCLAGAEGSDKEWRGDAGLRVLTPHPGEMSRLTGRSITEVQADRIGIARAFAAERNVVVVLKGEGTVIAFPDGHVWINPTGSPAMATGGTGDILTGLISGMMAQLQNEPNLAIAAAVYLHGLAGEVAARHLTEQSVVATDLLRFLPEATRVITNVPDPL